MIQSYDVGSLPFRGDSLKFSSEARFFGINEVTRKEEALNNQNFFEEMVLQSFIDKIKAGIDIPNYPQFRDMTEMFIELINGFEKDAGGYKISEKISVLSKNVMIPEVFILKKNSLRIKEITNKQTQLKICIIGPFTLSSILTNKWPEVFYEIGHVLSEIIENTIVNEKSFRIPLVSVDEPIFGLVDDPLLDYGSEGREYLLKAWEKIFKKINEGGAKSILHLHNTSNELFWDSDYLNIVESHVKDPLYSSFRVKKILEEKDKFLKGSIAVTDFDVLIKESDIFKLDDTNQKLVKIWTEINKGDIDPNIFLESKEIIKKRLKKIIQIFNVNRIPYIGPECGFKGFPTYESSLECLKRVSSAIL